MTLKMVGPTLLGFRLPFPGDNDARGSTYQGAASLFWLLGDRLVVPPGHKPSAKLAALHIEERKRLAGSLAETLDRTAYYRRRFDDAVRVLIERKRQVGGTTVYDAYGSQLYDILGLILTSARSFVDLIIYGAARLATKSEREADIWTIEHMKKANTPEAHILLRHDQWFHALSSYRNALIHRGHRNSFGGYFPRDCNLPEARNPKFNVMILPDITSIQRPNRPHQWTYQQGTRIEDLVDQVSKGLESFALDIGAEWGGAVPPEPKVPHEQIFNVLVVVQKPAFFLMDRIAVWPVFTNLDAAALFHRVMMNNANAAQPFEIHCCYQIEHPAFIVCIDPGSADVLKSEGVEKVWLLLNPSPVPREFHKFLVRDFPISAYDALDAANDKIYLFADSFPGIDTLFMIRTVPEYLRHL